MKVFSNEKYNEQLKKMKWNDTVDYMAGKTGLSKRTIRDYMKMFVADGIIDEYGNMTAKAKEAFEPDFDNNN